MTDPRGRGEVVFMFNEGSTRDTDQPGRAAREPSDHAGGTRGCGRKEGRRALREVATPFLFIGDLCVNDCGWRLSPVEVVLLKCCRVSGLFGTSLLLVYCVYVPFL